MRRFLRAALGTHGVSAWSRPRTDARGPGPGGGPQSRRVLLDLGLPDGDGLEATRQLREWTTTPIIVLSARGQEADKIAALDAGADDYLTKPFGVGELLARMRVALRHRASGGEATADRFEAGGLRVDLARRTVTVAGERGAPHAHGVQAARGAGAACRQGAHPPAAAARGLGSHSATQTQALRVYMTQLRHKIEQDPARPRLLVTEPGVGYRLKDG